MKIKTLLTAPMLVLSSIAAQAHEGHGSWAAQAHEYEHAVWLVMGVVCALAIVIQGRRYFSARAARRDERQD